MTQAQKIQYMEIGADLCKFHLKHEDMDMLVSIYELVIEKEGNADMMDVAKIQAKVKERAIKSNKKWKTTSKD